MVVNSVGKKYAEVDRAYLAGFFDADGAIMAVIEMHQEKKFGFRVRVIIRIAQKNQGFLVDLQKGLGWGKLRINREVYELDIKDQDRVRSFIKLVLPYSKIKNNQLKIGLKILDSSVNSKQNLLEKARLADTLSGFNVRSHGRRLNYTAKIETYFSSND